MAHTYYLTCRLSHGPLQIVLSLFACVLYVWETDWEMRNAHLPFWVIVVEVALSVLFALDYLLHLFLADSRAHFIFSKGSFVDIVTILPVISLLLEAPSFGFLRILRVFRVVRILRIYRLFAAGGQDSMAELNRQVRLHQCVHGVLCSAVCAAVYVS